MKTKEIKVTRSVEPEDAEKYFNAGYEQVTDKNGNGKNKKVVSDTGDVILKPIIDLGNATITVFETVDEIVSKVSAKELISTVNTAQSVTDKEKHAAAIAAGLGIRTVSDARINRAKALLAELGGMDVSEVDEKTEVKVGKQIWNIEKALTLV